MKVLWLSDLPTAASGYGQQTKMIAPYLKRQGIDIEVLGVGYTGGPIIVDGVRVIGVGQDPFGRDILYDLLTTYPYDALITFKNPYLFDSGMGSINTPWFPVVPVETSELSYKDKEAIHWCTRPIAIAEHGREALIAAGHEPLYAPLMIDPKVFCPGDKAAARKALNISPDTDFVALFVGDNRTYPSRKAIEQIIAAWAMFVEEHPQSILILHTYLGHERGGHNIELLLNLYKVPAQNVTYTHQIEYIKGLSPQQMARMYNAADLLINPSVGGGFELALVEAQACGTMVLSTDWTAMSETSRYGVVVKSRPPFGEREVAPQGGFFFRPTAAAIAAGLEAAQTAIHTTPIDPQVMHQWASTRYGTDTVLPQWLQIMRTIERLLEGDIDNAD